MYIFIHITFITYRLALTIYILSSEYQPPLIKSWVFPLGCRPTTHFIVFDIIPLAVATFATAFTLYAGKFFEFFDGTHWVGIIQRGEDSKWDLLEAPILGVTGSQKGKVRTEQKHATYQMDELDQHRQFL